MKNVQTIPAAVDFVHSEKGYGFMVHDQERYFFHAKDRREIQIDRGHVAFIPSNRGLMAIDKNQTLVILESARDDQQRLRAVYWIPQIEMVIPLYVVCEIVTDYKQDEPIADNEKKIYTQVATKTITERIVNVGTKEECAKFMQSYESVLKGELVLRKVTGS